MNKKNCFVFKLLCMTNYLEKSNPHMTRSNIVRSLDGYMINRSLKKASSKKSNDSGDEPRIDACVRTLLHAPL